jgi:hypothetical protein
MSECHKSLKGCVLILERKEEKDLELDNRIAHMEIAES